MIIIRLRVRRPSVCTAVRGGTRRQFTFTRSRIIITKRWCPAVTAHERYGKRPGRAAGRRIINIILLYALCGSHLAFYFRFRTEAAAAAYTRCCALRRREYPATICGNRCEVRHVRTGYYVIMLSLWLLYYNGRRSGTIKCRRRRRRWLPAA